MLRQFALLGLLVFGLLALAGCGSDLVGPTPTDGAPASAPGVNLEVPDLMISAYQGETALGGEEVALSSVLAQGKPVVLNFWAALCPPCRAEMPDFQRVYDSRSHEVTIIGIDIGPQQRQGTLDGGRELLAELGISYPAGTTFDERVVRNFRIVGMPTTFFIFPNGRLLRSWAGLMNEEKVNEFIDELVLGAPEDNFRPWPSPVAPTPEPAPTPLA